MKKITFLLVAMLAFCWQGHAQSTATQNFGTNGTDSAPTVLTINVGDITVNSGQPLQAVSLGTFTSHYSSPTGGTTYCGNWYAFDLAVTGGVADGTSIAAGCDADFNGLDVTGFTTITLTSNDIDAYSDTVYFDIDLDITYLTPSCTPAVSNSETEMPDCGNSQFSIDVDIASVGDGTVITDGLGGSFPIVAGTVTAGPYASGTNVTLTMEHSDPACNFPLGNFQYFCPPSNIDCANATPMVCGDTINASSVGSTGNQEGSGCSIGDNGIWFTFTGTGGDMTVESTASFDHEMAITSGACGSLVNIVCDDGSVGMETHTFTSSPGETYFVYIAHYASGNTTTGTIDVTLTCAAIPTCFEATNLDVTVLPGDTSATLSWDVEGSATAGYNWVVMNEFDDPDVDTPVASGSTAVGVTTDTATGLTAGNDYDFYVQSNCDTNGLSTWAGPFSFTSLTPPANDTCASAEVAPVGLGSCGTSVTGHNAGATDSGVAQAGCATATYSGGDVWYTFDMPVGETELVYTRSASVFSTTQVELYSGTCGALVEEGCTTSATASFTGLTSGATYYLRIYDWGNNDIGSFTFCLNTPPTCYDPSNLSAAFVAPNSADLSWDAPTQGTAPTAYNWEVVPAGNGQGNGIVDSGSAAGLTATATGLTANTLYDFYVQSDCGGGDTSSWAGPFTFNAGYCIPTGTSSSSYIDNFTTTGAAGMNIDNSASGFATGNYGDYYSTHYVELASDQNFDFSVGIVGGTVGAAIWIDWNNDFVFDLSEVVYSTTSFGNGPFTGTITVPNGTANGDYRMRVLIDWNDSNPGDDDACSFGSGRGEVEDYKITVDNSLSVANLEISQFTYFPNPVNNTLSLRGVKDIQNVAVYNMLGQEVLRTAPNTVNSDVDMSGLQSGTYFVKVMIENTTKTIKVIKK
ncbi:MAG: hypothetical protein CMP05_09965 [Xanthomarina sp.]|uniref:GEVED domain-containing protein n=1 Tax=Xanthomarina TaxID=1868329 RepID=UPI000C53A9B5|nr:GEVED domain-containing protein [Xanthomarina sp.]MBF62311.1 hypothetical protein [Xanthomarina sp.]HAI19332.1 hypothetical protein [Xanthomarina gelatinilytica]